ncbi:MAG: hypothetical protein CVT65_03865 [Actinobacteria bacterium HGW-Actinobacteria-5]|nr:MAG: hypothetical protein CVT65_03865 [Actinobacteria bacterium HGW-Actinobacteria-5]
MSVQLKLECSFDGTGSSWTTLTSWSGKDYLLQARGIDITRGRDDETGEPISPGTIGFVLDNADYRFSPGITSSPCYPYLEQPGSLLRLSAWVNGAWQKLFYGTAQSWTATLDGDLTGKKSICTVTATDTLGVFPSYMLQQASSEIIKRYRPVAYWPLNDTESPATALVGQSVLKDPSGTASGWGSGSLLPMDEGDTAHPLFTSNSTGLVVSSMLTLAAPCTVVFVLMSAPTATALGLITLLRGMYNAAGTTQYDLLWRDSVGLGISTTTAGFGVPTRWPALLALSSDGHGYMVDADGNTYTATPAVSPGSLRIKTSIQLNTHDYVLGSTWSAGHLAIFDRALSLSDLSGMAAQLIGSRTPASETAASLLASWVEMSVTGGTVGEAALPPCKDRDAAEVMNSLVASMGARLVDDLAGGLSWIDFGPSTTPVAIPKTTTDLAWGTSSTGWMSEQTVTFPDGSTYTATRSDGARKTGPGLEAVHSDPGKDRSMADWNVHSGTLGGRCSQVPVDMMGLTEAQRASLAALAPGSRITPPSYAYMPSGLILIVEGVEHHIDAETWTATFKTSPDIYSRLLIWDSGDTWDGGKLWAP